MALRELRRWGPCGKCSQWLELVGVARAPLAPELGIPVCSVPFPPGLLKKSVWPFAVAGGGAEAAAAALWSQALRSACCLGNTVAPSRA